MMSSAEEGDNGDCGSGVGTATKKGEGKKNPAFEAGGVLLLCIRQEGSIMTTSFSR